VGDSMRASLQEVAVSRLGRVDYALLAPRFFRAALADDLAASAEFTEHFDRVCPIIMLNGGATHAERRTRADRVSLLGVDDRFWAMNSSPSPSPGEGRGEDPTPSPFQGEGRGEGSWMPSGRVVILNEPLAYELGAAVGDDVLLRTGKPSPIATETLLARRDHTVSTLRLTVAAIGDEAAVKWQLHLDLGKDLTVLDEGGREARLRFVACCKAACCRVSFLWPIRSLSGFSLRSPAKDFSSSMFRENRWPMSSALSNAPSTGSASTPPARRDGLPSSSPCGIPIFPHSSRSGDRPVARNGRPRGRTAAERMGAARRAVADADPGVLTGSDRRNGSIGERGPIDRRAVFRLFFGLGRRFAGNHLAAECGAVALPRSDSCGRFTGRNRSGWCGTYASHACPCLDGASR